MHPLSSYQKPSFVRAGITIVFGMTNKGKLIVKTIVNFKFTLISLYDNINIAWRDLQWV